MNLDRVSKGDVPNQINVIIVRNETFMPKRPQKSATRHPVGNVCLCRPKMMRRWVENSCRPSLVSGAYPLADSSNSIYAKNTNFWR